MEVQFESPFPSSPRVLFTPNPIETTICQLRFPTILQIGEERPAAFQQKIRHEFPVYTERAPEKLVLPMEIFPGVPKQLRAYDFSTSDNNWTVTLTEEFIALQTRSYDRWENFKEKLMLPLGSLIETYKVSYFVRIGLRYLDLIRRSQLNRDGVPWNKLLKDHVAGEFTDEAVVPHITEKFTHLVMTLNATDGEVIINHGTYPKDGEECYIVDADFYRTASTSVETATEVLDRLKRHAGRFFRWFISDDLSAAMSPTRIE